MVMGQLYREDGGEDTGVSHRSPPESSNRISAEFSVFSKTYVNQREYSDYRILPIE